MSLHVTRLAMTCTSRRASFFSRSVVNFRSVRFNAYAHPSNRPTTRCTFENPPRAMHPKSTKSARKRDIVANCAALVQLNRRPCALVSAGCSSGGRNAFLAHGGDVAARGKRFLPPTARFGSRFLGTRKSPCDCDGCENRDGWLAHSCVPVAPCDGISNPKRGRLFLVGDSAHGDLAPRKFSLFTPPSSPYAPYASNCASAGVIKSNPPPS